MTAALSPFARASHPVCIADHVAPLRHSQRPSNAAAAMVAGLRTIPRVLHVSAVCEKEPGRGAPSCRPTFFDFFAALTDNCRTEGGSIRAGIEKIHGSLMYTHTHKAIRRHFVSFNVRPCCDAMSRNRLRFQPLPKLPTPSSALLAGPPH